MLQNGVTVYWDGIKEVKVTIPPSMAGQVCGLCGNADGNPDNDQVLGPHVTSQAGSSCPNLQAEGRTGHPVGTPLIQLCQQHNNKLNGMLYVCNKSRINRSKS